MTVEEVISVLAVTGLTPKEMRELYGAPLKSARLYPYKSISRSLETMDSLNKLLGPAMDSTVTEELQMHVGLNIPRNCSQP